ncbi:MAG: DUF4163 domain-containing protein [Bacteroidales bacterium]|nr:DUF4163 domain-containing protein [Bacteroidales bacterium]NLO50998.1 DUF3298 and DUF4163 domain-containing protein [Bacteroidales bacterium]
MKTKTILLVALVATFWACNRHQADEKPIEYGVIEQSTITGDTAYYYINQEFPVFKADQPADDSLLKPLNSRIESFMDTAAQYYWGMEVGDVPGYIDTVQARGKFELYTTYEILLSTSDTISLRLETYSYALGAHGFTAFHTYNYDLRHQHFIGLEEVLDLSSDTNINIINELLARYFENPEDCFTEVPTIDVDEQLWGFRPEYLVFFYEAYELGAYVCGSAEVKIPTQELQKRNLLRMNEDLAKAK